MFQPAYTMLGHNWLDERGAEGIGYVRAVGTLFPRQLQHIMPQMKAITEDSFEGYKRMHGASDGKIIHSKRAFTSLTDHKFSGQADLPVYDMYKKLLCKMNGICFFGEELGMQLSVLLSLPAPMLTVNQPTMRSSWPKFTNTMSSWSVLRKFYESFQIA